MSAAKLLFSLLALAVALEGPASAAVAGPLPLEAALPGGDDARFRPDPPGLTASTEPQPADVSERTDGSAPAEARELGILTPRRGLRVSSPYGRRVDPLDGALAEHRGIDLPAAVGTPVAAADAGVVRWAGPDGSYGNLVTIDHGDGIETRYGHLSHVLVRAGARVRRGASIGLVGSTGRSTGAHLHYEVLFRGRQLNPSRRSDMVVDQPLPQIELAPPSAPVSTLFWREDPGALPMPLMDARSHEGGAGR